jgi:hypothetical protein
MISIDGNKLFRLKCGFSNMPSNAPEEKGKRFEKYVIDKFDPNYFDIVHQTHPWETNKERFILSSLDPDYLLRYKPSGEDFAVECKYRSRLRQDGLLECCRPRQFQHYKEFMQTKEIPVYIVIGLGGDAEDPRELYVIPLRDMQYPALYPSVYLPFDKNPLHNFFWQNSKLS